MIVLASSLKNYRTEFMSDSYVSSPPAAFIYDEQGNNFSLGLRYREFKDRDRVNGHMSFNVLYNSRETGEFASHIEKRANGIRIFTNTGWKIWNGHSFI